MIIKKNLKSKAVILVSFLAAAWMLFGCRAAQSDTPQSQNAEEQTFELRCFESELQAAVLKTELCTDPTALEQQNIHVESREQPFLAEDGTLNPALILGNQDAVELLMIVQSYKNIGAEDLELSLLSNQLYMLDPKTHKRVEGAKRLDLAPVYLELSQGFSSRDQNDGLYLVKVPTGEEVQVTMGYPIPKSCVGQEMEYRLRPFGDTNAKKAEAEVRFVP